VAECFMMGGGCGRQGQRRRHRKPAVPKNAQQRHPPGERTAGFLVAREPVGHVAGQNHIVELAMPELGPFAPADVLHRREIAGQELIFFHWPGC
jgi:hypothetical protein